MTNRRLRNRTKQRYRCRKENILNADRVDFYVKKKTLTATGHVILNDGKNVLKGDRLDYDYDKERAILRQRYRVFGTRGTLGQKKP